MKKDSNVKRMQIEGSHCLLLGKQVSRATMGNMEDPKRKCHVTEQTHYWPHIQRKWNHNQDSIRGPHGLCCTSHSHSLWVNVSIHQWRDSLRKSLSLPLTPLSHTHSDTPANNNKGWDPIICSLWITEESTGQENRGKHRKDLYHMFSHVKSKNINFT